MSFPHQFKYYAVVFILQKLWLGGPLSRKHFPKIQGLLLAGYTFM